MKRAILTFAAAMMGLMLLAIGYGATAEAQRVFVGYYPNVGYSSTQTYYQADMITTGGQTYISLPPGPQSGNTPSSSTTGYCLGYAVPCWAQISGSGGGGGSYLPLAGGTLTGNIGEISQTMIAADANNINVPSTTIYTHIFDQSTFALAPVTSGLGSQSQDYRTIKAYGPGLNLGSFDGAGGRVVSQFELEGTFAERGISQMFGTYGTKHAAGDFNTYNYLYSDGGANGAADEGIGLGNYSGGETTGYYHGTISSTTGTGDTAPVLSTATSGNNWTTDGAFLLDITKGTVNGNYTGVSTPFGSTYLFQIPVSNTLPLSSAWGTLTAVIPNPGVTPNNSVTNTYTVALGAIGGSSPSFTAGKVCIAGPNYPEQAILTNPGAASGGMQTITLTYHNPNGSGTQYPIIFQGGVCGQYISQDQDLAYSQYRTSYYAFGAVTTGNLIYGVNSHGSLTSQALPFASGAQTTTGGYHLYPGAEIVENTSTGATPVLEPNSVAWAASDVIENPHYPVVNTNALKLDITQNTPANNANSAVGTFYARGYGVGGVNYFGFRMINTGNCSQYSDCSGSSNYPQSPFSAYTVSGYWASPFHSDYGPSALGAMMDIGGTFKGDTTPFLLAQLRNGTGSGPIIGYNPALGATYVPKFQITGITGSTQCLQASTTGVVSGTGSACGSGGGGGGTVTSVGAGGSSSPNVAVSVTNPTTTPAISVVSYSGGPGVVSPYDTRQKNVQVIEAVNGSVTPQMLYSDGIAWSLTPNYGVGAKVTYSSACYQSIQSGPGGNVNHTPSSSPTYWSAYTCPTTPGGTITQIQLALQSQFNPSGTGSIAAATTSSPPILTMTAVTGTIFPGMTVSGTGVTTANIVAQLSGTTGGVGTYQISASQTVASEALTFSSNVASYMNEPLTIIVDGVTHNTNPYAFFNLAEGCVPGGYNNPSASANGAGQGGINLSYNSIMTNCQTAPTGSQIGVSRRIWIPYYSSLQILLSPSSVGGNPQTYSQVYSLSGVAAAGIYPANYSYFNMFDYSQTEVGAYQAVTPLASATITGGGYIDSWFHQHQQRNITPSALEGNPTFTIDGAVQWWAGGTEDFFGGQYYNFANNTSESGAQSAIYNTQTFNQVQSLYKYWHTDPLPFSSSFSLTYPNGQALEGSYSGPENVSDEIVWYSSTAQTGATNNTPVTWPATSPTHTWGDATAAAACTTGSTWTDTVGSANFTTNTGSPSCAASTINGHTALVLSSGTSDSMIASSFLTSAFPKTFLFVFQPSAICNGSSDLVLLGSNTAAGAGSASLLCSHATDVYSFNDFGAQNNVSTTTPAAGTPVCGEIVVDGGNSRMSINGVVTSFWNTATPGGAMFGPGLLLGKGLTNSPWYGAWGWLSVYDGNASATQVATTMSSVCSAWGISNAGAW